MSSSGLKNVIYVSITKHPSEGHEISNTKTTVLIWKWKTYFIQLHNLIHDFWKKNITRCTFLHHGASMLHQKSLQVIKKNSLSPWFVFMWTSATIMDVIFWDLLVLYRIFFHYKCNEAWLLVINMVHTSCLSCRTT